MFDEIFIGNLFLPRMNGKIAKIRTRKNFVPHGNLQFCLSFVIFVILMTKDRKTWHFNDKSEEFANVNFSFFVRVSSLLIVACAQRYKNF